MFSSTLSVSRDVTVGPPISVIIPARNEAPRVGECLHSIQLALAEARIVGAEIVVVDDDSRDDTAAVARAHGVNVLHQSPAQGPLAAWGLGVHATSSHCLVFVDADCRVSFDALVNLLGPLERPEVGVVAGRSQPSGGVSPTGMVQRSADFSALLLHEIKSRLRNHDFLPIGRLMAVRRAAWRVEDGGMVPCDRVVAKLAKSAGWEVVYAPDATVQYQRLTSFEALREDYLRTNLARQTIARAHDPLPFNVVWRAAWAGTFSSPKNALAWATCRVLLMGEQHIRRQPPPSSRWPA